MFNGLLSICYKLTKTLAKSRIFLCLCILTEPLAICIIMPISGSRDSAREPQPSDCRKICEPEPLSLRQQIAISDCGAGFFILPLATEAFKTGDTICTRNTTARKYKRMQRKCLTDAIFVRFAESIQFFGCFPQRRFLTCRSNATGAAKRAS